MILVEFVKEFATQKGVSSDQIALAWLLSQKPFIASIFGTTSEERLKENLATKDMILSKADLQIINAKLVV